MLIRRNPPALDLAHEKSPGSLILKATTYHLVRLSCGQPSLSLTAIEVQRFDQLILQIRSLIMNSDSIEGIGESYAQKLKAAGISTTE